MELAEAERVVREVYGGTNPYDASHRSRKGLALSDESLRYGEIVGESLEQVLSAVPEAARGVFYDLGSGSGRTLLLAALISGFGRVVGVELLEELHTMAQAAVARFDRDHREQLVSPQRDVRIELRLGDLREVDLGDADVVYVHCTCFQTDLMRDLARQVEATLRPGAYVLTTTKMISAPSLDFVKAMSAEMDWGPTSMFISRRRSDPTA